MCRGCHVVRFFRNVLFAPLGFQLIAWQEKFLRDVYGTVDAETGERRIIRAYGEYPKKQGKSFLLGGCPLYHLTAEGVDNPEAYGAAAAKDQASIVYKSALRLLRGNSILLDRLKPLESTRRIVRRDGGGLYAVLSADGDIQDGLEPSLNLIDELHRWKNAKARTLYDILIAGQVSRPEPLTIEITTAGDVYDSPICWQEHQLARSVLDGSVKMPRFYPVICTVDEKKLKSDPEYWKSREARAAANPSHEDHGGFLRDAAIELNMQTLAEPAYKRYHLNIWNQKAEQWMAPEVWHACSSPTRPLIDRRCYLGVDLSKSSDLSSVVAVFLDESDDSIDILPFFFMPKGKVAEIRKKVPAPIERWIEQGLIEANDGPVVDYTVIKNKIAWMKQTFRVEELCYDPWNAHRFIQELVDELGLTCIDVSQTASKLNSPMKWLMELALQKKVRHEGNEVLNWNCDCLTVKVDANGNIAPAKNRLQSEGKRIDGMAALITALFRLQLSRMADPYSNGARVISA